MTKPTDTKHNLASLRKDGEGFIKRFLNLHDALDTIKDGYAEDFEALFVEASTTLGMDQAILTKELKAILKAKKAKEKDAKLSSVQKDQRDRWRAAMQGTQFDIFADLPAAG